MWNNSASTYQPETLIAMYHVLTPEEFLHYLSISLYSDENEYQDYNLFMDSVYANEGWVREKGDNVAGYNVEEAGDTAYPNAASQASPLIIDLDGKGIDTLPLSNGVYFDHTGNGFRIITGWVAPEDGLLVRDLNGDGRINNGGELFGDYTLLRSGKRAANGFEALKELNDYEDAETGDVSVMNTNDAAWSELLLWIDANSDARSSASELYTLDDLGIVSINLSYQNINNIDAHGNHHRQASSVTMLDGEIRDIVDVWFARNAKDSIAKGRIPVTDEIKALPDIRGFGTTYSLHQAMMRDTSGQLQSLVEQFITEQNESVRRNLVVQIIYRWTGTTTKIAAMDALTAERYTGGTGTNAMAILNGAFDNIANAVYTHLMAQTHFLDLYLKMRPIGDGETFDLSGVARKILRVISEDQARGVQLLIDFVNNMYALTLFDSIDLEGFQNTLNAQDARYGSIVEIAGKNVIYVTNEINTFTGTNSGTVYWLDSNVNNIISGTGDDVFFFSTSDGTSTITDAGGNNKLMFFDDMNLDGITVTQTVDVSNGLDLEINIPGYSGFIIIKGYNNTSTYSIVLPDQSEHNIIDFIIPLEISTAEELAAITNGLAGHYKLVADIDLSGIAWTPMGTTTAPFTGVFDGNSHVIENLTINKSTTDYIGLFGYSKGTIKNLTLKDVSVAGKNYVGAIAGWNGNIITDCTVTGTSVISGSTYTGGLLGYNSNGRITGCSVTGDSAVNGSSSSVGGLIGNNSGGRITGCSVTGDSAVNGSSSNVGGLIGNNSSGTITNCSVTGESAVRGTGSYTGGFVGYNNGGGISKSYTESKVNGGNGTGGFVGYSYNATISMCYATGDVTGIIGGSSGGFVGTLGSGTVMNSFSTGKVAEVGQSAGFAGDIPRGCKIENCYTVSSHTEGLYNTKNGTVTNSYFNKDLVPLTNTKTEGRTTTQMSQQATYVNWDFDTVWEFAEGSAYPTLKGLDIAESLIISVAESPNITVQPLDITVLIDESIELTIEATVTNGILSHQWYISADGTENGTPIPGATQTSYTPPTDTEGKWYYYCEVINIDVAAFRNQTAVSVSDIVTMTVGECITVETPNITVHPTDISITIGELATLTVEATVSEGTLSYQWYGSFDGNKVSSTPIPGATQSTYTPPTDIEGTRYFYCEVINTDATETQTASTTSDIVSVTVITLSNAELPVIIWQSADIEVFADDQATLAIEATVTEGTLTYQWYESADGADFGGILIPGATESMYSPPTNAVGVWYYYCEITNTDVLATGDQIAVTVIDVVAVMINSNDEIVQPEILTLPSNSECNVGEIVELIIEVTETEKSINYQWYESIDGTNTDGILLFGADQASYIPPTDEEGIRYYYCVITYTDEFGNQISVLISDIVIVTVSNSSVSESEDLSA